MAVGLVGPDCGWSDFTGDDDRYVTLWSDEHVLCMSHRSGWDETVDGRVNRKKRWGGKRGGRGGETGNKE